MILLCSSGGVRDSLFVTDCGNALGGFDLSAVANPDHPVPFAVIPVAAEGRSGRAAEPAVVADENRYMSDSFMTHYLDRKRLVQQESGSYDLYCRRVHGSVIRACTESGVYSDPVTVVPPGKDDT